MTITKILHTKILPLLKRSCLLQRTSSYSTTKSDNDPTKTKNNKGSSSLFSRLLGPQSVVARPGSSMRKASYSTTKAEDKNPIQNKDEGTNSLFSRLLGPQSVVVRPGSSINKASYSTTKGDNDTVQNKDEGTSSLFSRLLGPQSVVASPGSSLNRWSMFVPAFATHVCLGAPYGWSAISASLSREQGMVAAAAGDWSLDLCTYPMSVMIALGGLSAAVFGKWTMKIGSRLSLAVGGTVFGTGFLVISMGIMQHSLPMMYAGNVLYGVGCGLCYTPPIQALIEWFPDKKGLASGLVIAGFGSGALFFTSMMNRFTQAFAVMPQYLGRTLETVTESGKIFAKLGEDTLQEVVYATTADLAKLPYKELTEGFYLVGSGNTGVASGIACVSAVYASVVIASAFLLRRPAQGYLPAGWTPPATSGGGITSGNVNVGEVMRTPQFWLLFSTSTLLATGGMGLMSVAKPMIAEVFTGSMPTIVTAAFASSYLMAMATGNLGGRIGWAAVSDKIGRRATFNIFTFGAVPLFASMPYCIEQVVTNPTGPMAQVYLGAFCCSTVVAVSIMGGVFAVLPAYEADLYGPKYVQAIHGRFLLAATTATITGPMMLLNLRRMAESRAMQDLLSKVDPTKFREHFSVDLSQSQSLIEAKSLTISKLMTIMPEGTLDPSPFIYSNTMYTMACLVGVSGALHLMVRPVDRKYFEKTD